MTKTSLDSNGVSVLAVLPAGVAGTEGDEKECGGDVCVLFGVRKDEEDSDAKDDTAVVLDCSETAALANVSKKASCELVDPPNMGGATSSEPLSMVDIEVTVEESD